jgi:AraC-like DNA-binding protein
MKRKPLWKPHLVVHEIQLATGREWVPDIRGWCVAWVGNGASYWHGREAVSEIQPGSVVVFPAGAGEVLRASQINDVDLFYFSVESDRLSGLLSVHEQNFLNQRKSSGACLFTPDSPMAARVREIPVRFAGAAASLRLQLLQVFMDVFDWKTEPEILTEAAVADGRKRLRQVLDAMAASDFVELSVSDLAPMIACSPRHFNRLFREELGASFREKQLELRLAKACEMLATSDAKVVEVALESGYQSISVFSGLFKKHTGLSPGQWRRQELKSGTAQPVRC